MFEPLTGPEALAEAAAQRRFGWLLLALWLNSVALAIVLRGRGLLPDDNTMPLVLANFVLGMCFAGAPKGERLQAAGVASVVLALPLLLGGVGPVLRAVIWGVVALGVFVGVGRWSTIACVHSFEIIFVMMLFIVAEMILLPILGQARDRARVAASRSATVHAARTAIEDLADSPVGDQSWRRAR